MSSASDPHAWRRNAMRAAAARHGLSRGLRAAIPIEQSLPDPLADALQRAEAAIARRKSEVMVVTAENPPMDYIDV